MENLKKKGQVIHMVIFGMIALFLTIAFLFLAYFISSVNDSIQDNDQISDQVKGSLGNVNSRLPNVLDAAFALVIIGSAVVLIVSSYMVDTSLIFLFITLPIFLVTVLANAIFANAIDELGNSAALASTYAGFPMMSFLAEHWLPLTVIVGLLSILAYFGGRSLK